MLTSSFLSGSASKASLSVLLAAVFLTGSNAFSLAPMVNSKSLPSLKPAARQSGHCALKMVATPERATKIGFTTLTKNIKTPDPIPDEGIELANELMRSGRLYRYNADSEDTCMVSRCETALAEYTGHKYCVALNSCGSAIFMALHCVGAGHGDKVLSNAFTFTAVPSAIVHAGCEPVYVECTDNFLMCPEHLAEMADKSGAKYCVISHMRGKVANMDKILDICNEKGITLIEDCAHSLGVTWNGGHSGHHGEMACISSQSYKMLNSGEGGFLLTNDDELAAKMILFAGAYEKLYQKHKLRPADEYFERLKHETPNYSMRMHAVTAAMILPQIATLDERIEVYNRRYAKVEEAMNSIPHLTVPKQLEQVGGVYDSVQFTLDGLTESQLDTFLQACRDRGVPVEIFGAKTNARYFRNWRYTEDSMAQFNDLPRTEKIIQWTGDVRLPLPFEDEDFDTMTTILKEAMEETLA